MQTPYKGILFRPFFKRLKTSQPRQAASFSWWTRSEKLWAAKYDPIPRPERKSQAKEKKAAKRYRVRRSVDHAGKSNKMRAYLDFITTPTNDTPGTLLLLHYDSRRYVIGNFSEGAIRANTEQSVGLRNVSHLLLTGQTRWANVGGLLGFVLSLADLLKASNGGKEDKAGRTEGLKLKEHSTPSVSGSNRTLSITGAPNLNYFLATTRKFIFRTGVPINATEVSAAGEPPPGNELWSPTWSDENINVWTLPLKPSKIHQDKSRDVPSTKHETNGRKRSFEEYSEDEQQEARHYARDRSRSVVRQMFDSDWRMDRLIDVRLSEVKAGAQIFKRNRTTGNLETYEGPRPASGQAYVDQDVLIRQPWPAALKSELPETRPSSESVSYIIKSHPQRGKFLPQKATDLEVQPKSLWAKLAQGLSVENIHGMEITPDMVLEPGRPGNGFAVIDLPSAEYVEDLTGRPEWRHSKVMEGVGAMIWMLGPGVARDERLKSFRADFEHLRHVVASPDLCDNRLAIETAARSAFQHHHVEPKIFTKPWSSKHDSSKWSDLIGTTWPDATIARPGTSLCIEPRVEDGRPLKGTPLLDEGKLDEAVVADLDVITKEHPEVMTGSSSSPHQQYSHHGEVEVLVLGTGSSHPSPHRNVSGSLVRVPNCGTYLLDCGEGTLGTLIRMYGEDGIKPILRDLKMIWISHMHADHHLGLVSVIKAWYREVHGSEPYTSSSSEAAPGLIPNRLAIVSDKPMLQWLKEYANIEDFGYSRILPLATVPSSYHMGKKSPTGLWDADPSSSTYNDVRQTATYLDYLNIASFATVRVNHCNGSQAVSITFKSSFKLSYSGDCRPSTSFASIGEASDVLIHEATFEDEHRGEAFAKKHSTAGEALLIADKMNAKVCLLTHFSQRYPHMPSLGTRSNQESLSAEQDGATTDLLEEEAKDDDAPLDQVDAPAPNKMQSHALDTRAIQRLIEGRKLKIIVAFDYMHFKMKDIPRYESKEPLLRALYAKIESGEPMASQKSGAKQSE
ncbi:MAG: hypothetical protein M1828_001317 [Chrysothrix sp. TS-e1954]|nr:MAG: hypothetical protein M1828_001317 [Chrysothrix sp. TS-e1954]